MEGDRILARPSLQARGRLPALCAAAETSERPPPAGLARSSLCSTPDRWGRFPVWLCWGLEWMPGIDLQPGSAAGELNSRGGQSTEFLFLGVLMEKNRSAKQVCQAQTQMEPHWCELREFLLPGSHS